MITLYLDDLRFNAFHGLHYEESIIGSEYSVSAEIRFQSPGSVICTIEETVDYSSVFFIIKKHMAKPTPLLETLVMQIAAEIAETFTQVREIDIKLVKLQAPVENLNGKLGVGYAWRRTQG